MTSRAHELFKQIVEADDPAAAVNDLIETKQPETEYLEFKGAGKIQDKQVKELWSKNLSAFANTSGGVLIWGIDAKRMKDPDNEGHEFDGASGYNVAENSSAFIQLLKKVLLEACVEPVQGVDIRSVTCEEGDVVVCLIPEGNHKPYRAELAGKQYFQRVGDNSVVIPHSILRSLFYPTTNAILELAMEIQPPFDSRTQSEPWKAFLYLTNQGTATARDLFVRWDRWVPDGIIPEASSPKFNYTWEHGWSLRVGSNGLTSGASYREPLHPGERIEICRLHFFRSGKNLSEQQSIPTAANITGRMTFYVADHPAQVFRVEFFNGEITCGLSEKVFHSEVDGESVPADGT